MNTITVIGGTLFEVAAQQLGNALQWANVARANGLRDPQLQGTNHLIIPPYSDAYSDGIGAQ